jgi:ATP-binding cassette subfamily G (WHITE) protein 2 (PDR)
MGFFDDVRYGALLTIRYMPGWSRWINYLDPIAYGFEALMVNEFGGREFSCATVIPSGPGYQGATGTERTCSAQGSTPGSLTVSGTNYLAVAYEYYP